MWLEPLNVEILDDLISGLHLKEKHVFRSQKFKSSLRVHKKSKTGQNIFCVFSFILSIDCAYEKNTSDIFQSVNWTFSSFSTFHESIKRRFLIVHSTSFDVDDFSRLDDCQNCDQVVKTRTNFLNSSNNFLNVNYCDLLRVWIGSCDAFVKVVNVQTAIQFYNFIYSFLCRF